MHNFDCPLKSSRVGHVDFYMHWRSSAAIDNKDGDF